MATERDVESEKFALRTFLVRLGMSGAEFGAARKWLCRNLSGNASFPNNEYCNDYDFNATYKKQ
jgi:hypothetical protein